MFKNKKTMIFITLLLFVCFASATFASSKITIVINGTVVPFSNKTGYPYVDKNYRTMVPLAITMETAGAKVGYDSNKSTAILLINQNRIEIPIGLNVIYVDGDIVSTDTVAVTNNGRTYLPISAILSAAGFSVTWDESTNTINAYNPNSVVSPPIDSSSINQSFYPIDTCIHKNPIYPELYNPYPHNCYPIPMPDIDLSDSEIINSDQTLITYSDSNADTIWISNVPKFQNIDMKKSDLLDLDINISNLQKSDFSSDYAKVYGFFEDSYSGLIIPIYIIDEITEEFLITENAEATFNDLRMKKVNGELYFNIKDLRDNNLY